MKTMKKILTSTISLLLIGCMAACGGSNGSGMKTAPASYDYYNSFATSASESYYDGYYEEDYYQADAGDYYKDDSSAVSNGSEVSNGEIFNDSARKLIKTYNLTLETENYDDLLTALNARISALGGYVESLQNYNGNYYNGYRNNRNASLTARIPSRNADAFVEFVGNSANVVRNNLSVEDITLEYVDTESRKTTYEVEQERLLALLEKADNLEDILVIEQRLTEVRYKLESMGSQLRTYDNLVDYATVYLSISEVKEYTAPEPESFGERISKSFTTGLSNVIEGTKNFLVNLAGALPGLVIFAIIVAIVVLIVSKICKGHKVKKAKKAAEYAAQRMAMAQKNAEENKN